MARSGDWLGISEESLRELCIGWREVLENPAKVAAFRWEEADVAKVLAAIGEFEAAREAWMRVDSSFNRWKKIEVREAARETMRDFASASVRYNRNMTEGDKQALGVHSRAKGRRVKPPYSVPVLAPCAGTPGQIKVFCNDSLKTGRAKPANVRSIIVFWAILDHEPASREELTHFSIGTSSPLYLNFGEEDRGKRVYMAACWQIERHSERGPMSEIFSCFIA
jgi:hypothetical protein